MTEDGKPSISEPTLFWILITSRCDPIMSMSEIAVLYRYYGLKENFDKISVRFGVSRQRIEQLHGNGLRKLRTSLQIKERLG